MTLRYAPGEARALVRGGAVVLLPAPVDAPVLEQLWDQLGAEPGVVEVLQVLTGAFGSSLRTVPPFAVAVVTDRRAHVAVRGALSVTLEVAGGERLHVDGDDVTTWSERVVDDVADLLVRTGAEPVAAGQELVAGPGALPLTSGAVLADVVAWRLVPRSSADAAATEAEPAATGASAAAPAAEEPSAAPAAAEPATAPVAPEPPATAPVEPELPEEPVSPVATVRPSEETIAPVLTTYGSLGVPPAPTAEPVPEPEPEPDDDYAHLWGSTVLRTVEDAAVRADDDEDGADDDASAPSAPPTPEPRVQEPAPVPPPPATPPAPSGPAEPLAAGGLIAGVPREWTGATPAAAHRAWTVGPDDEDPAPAVPADVALGNAPEQGAADPSSGVDHDGHTVLSSAIADLRAAAEQAAVPAPPAPEAPVVPAFTAPPAPGQQQILARTCSQGHANPPSRETCALCDAPLEGDAALAVRPPLGRVRISTGQTVELDRGVVVGRRPRTPRTQAADLPRLVTVPSPQQDISRSHVEISLEGWHVLVSDMATTNGTTLLRAGHPPRRLHPSEPVLVVDGDVADLGDGVTLTFEGIR